MIDRPNHAAEIKRAIVDPRALCETLGLLAGKGTWTRQTGGVIVRCPVHEDRSPSCSVQLRKGVVLWRCHACGAEGDALTLIAAVRGLSTKRDFRAVLREAATLAGLWAVVDEIDGRAPRASRPDPIPATTLTQDEPERVYPPSGEVATFWRSLGLVTDDCGISDMLSHRGLNPDLVDGRELARAILFDSVSPKWAVCKGGSWAQAGYRLIVPVYTPDGVMGSVRAWRVGEGDGPKRLPPYGHRASGLVMADAFGLAMLRGQRAPERVVIVEGEPDHLVWATRTTDAQTAVLGITSGSWSEAFTQKVPLGAEVIIRTDPDAAGDKYAAEITQTLRKRAFVRRAA